MFYTVYLKNISLALRILRRALFAYDAVVLDFEAVLGKEDDGLGVGEGFLFEDSGGEGVGGVVVEDGAGALDDDGAGVVFVGAEVDGAAGDLAASLEYRFVDVVAPHALSAEGREEGRVDVHHAVFVLRGDVPEAEPAGLDDQIDFGRVEDFGNAGTERVHIVKLIAAEDHRFQTQFAGAVDRKSVV